jgi:hypothetical protein
MDCLLLPTLGIQTGTELIMQLKKKLQQVQWKVSSKILAMAATIPCLEHHKSSLVFPTGLNPHLLQLLD